MEQQPKDACEEGRPFCSFPLLVLHLHDVTSCLLLLQLRKKKALKEKREPLFSHIPQTDRQRATLPPSFFPASSFSHRITASSSPFRLIPPSSSLFAPSHHLSPLPQTSLLTTLLHPLFPPPPRHSAAPSLCSIRHQLFFPGSVLFRAD